MVILSLILLSHYYGLSNRSFQYFEFLINRSFKPTFHKYKAPLNGKTIEYKKQPRPNRNTRFREPSNAFGNLKYNYNWRRKFIILHIIYGTHLKINLKLGESNRTKPTFHLFYHQQLCFRDWAMSWLFPCARTCLHT